MHPSPVSLTIYCYAVAWKKREGMQFEWDPAKDTANQEKHGISFVAATAVFADPAHLEEDVTKPEYSETRRKPSASWHPVGSSP